MHLCSVVLNMCHARALLARKLKTGTTVGWKDGFLLHMHVSCLKKTSIIPVLTSRLYLMDAYENNKTTVVFCHINRVEQDN